MSDKGLLTIGNKTVSGEDIFFIVEEGQANLGDFDKALEMIEAVAGTGADAIEFQLARAADFYVESAPGFKIYREREFSDEQHRELIGRAKDKGMAFIAAALSHRLVEPLAKAGCDAFNINASDLTNPQMIDAVVDSGRPFFLSLLFAREEEINWAVERVRKKNKKAPFAMLHGQHTMASGEHGVDPEHTSLGYLATLKEKYQVPVGLIDHTPLEWMPAVAAAAGAQIISKHLTLSRAEKGPDWHVCLEPDEIRRAIGFARAVKSSLNINTKVLAPGEHFDRSVMRRSIVASGRIPSGKTITREDIEFKRPGDGLDPSRYEEVLGKTVSRDIQKDEQIQLSDLKGGA